VFDDPNFERADYDRRTAYGQSKTATSFSPSHWTSRGQGRTGWQRFFLHPGIVLSAPVSQCTFRTEELRAAGIIDENGKPILDVAKKSEDAEQGASTGVWCATSRNSTEWAASTAENTDIAPLKRVGLGDDWKKKRDSMAAHRRVAICSRS